MDVLSEDIFKEPEIIVETENAGNSKNPDPAESIVLSSDLCSSPPTLKAENESTLDETKNELLKKLESMEVDLNSQELEPEITKEHSDVDEELMELGTEELPVEQVEAENNEYQEEYPAATENLVDIESLKILESSYFQNNQLIELARCSFPNRSDSQHYLKGCLFSPDGCCILTSVNSDGLHVFELPQDLYGQEIVSETREITKLKSVIHVKTNVSIYDFQWYPYMNSQMPETSFWISTAQNEPIKLFDAFNGNLTGSYRGYDGVDELEAAYAVSFSSDGQQIIGGYKKSIKIFNTAVPGRDSSEIPLKHSISCLATNYYKENVLVAGSWNKSISFFDLRSHELVLKTDGLHKGGYTYLKFFSNGDYLISGSRKDSSLLVWDMRNVKNSLELYEVPQISELKRRVDTNQRIYFDMSLYSWIVSGDTRGLLHVWNLSDDNEPPKEIQFPITTDCCNGVSLSPHLPILATSCGQYQLEDLDEEKEKDYEIDNSLYLWWFGKNKESEE